MPEEALNGGVKGRPSEFLLDKWWIKNDGRVSLETPDTHAPPPHCAAGCRCQLPAPCPIRLKFPGRGSAETVSPGVLITADVAATRSLMRP